MQISKDKYNDVIVALDGIRCDNRENKQYSEVDTHLRQMSDDVMQYIERKGYCKYIYGANCKFVRTLTERGYEVLQHMDYAKYKRSKAIKNWQAWLPIGISLIAIVAATYVGWFKPDDIVYKEQIEKRLKQLEMPPKVIPKVVQAYPPTIQQNPTIYPLDSAKKVIAPK